jgi:hypothetical protein
MGNFYTSFTVRGADQKSVVKAMSGRKCAVSPTVNGYTVIWDAECETQDENLIHELGQKLSSGLVVPVLAVLNHDDDVLWYALYDSKGKLDEYNSAPGYFNGDATPPTGGNAQLLTKTMAPAAASKSVDQVLRSTDYAFALERHSELLATLGMPPFAASGYRYISDGELPAGLDKNDLKFAE